MSVHSGAQSSTGPNTSTIGAANQIDCFVEYFYENICALKGYDDVFDLALHNSKLPNGHKLAPKFVDIEMPVQLVLDNKTVFVSSNQNHFPMWDNKYDYLFAQEITPPPPKRNNEIV
ncbi:MAG: hypothetical protein DI598_14405 [Pseudopedobacter saltans]|uniref:Uncharacterized protein n=1 Tax=Pseudopedobacter saltans TaxID=151895 RepID=A0A2W5GMQ3_9SPHI|nr:MAG: hypothetical protein DI598_14405 [Pseudopedobacter saltans]